MITIAMYEYLTDPVDLAPADNVTFNPSQTVGSETVTDRNEARRLLRSKVGRQIYAQRRPRDGSWHTAMTLQLISQTTIPVLVGGSLDADAIVQVDVFTRGDGANSRAHTAANLCKLACESYCGTWGVEHTTKVFGVIIERESEVSEPPKDGDDWIFRYSLDFNIFYQQATAAV